jgi:dynein heavy chain, axonemal
MTKPISKYYHILKEIRRLSLITVFKGFSDSFKENILDWRLIFDSTEPHRQIIPLKWQSELNSFQKLMVLRCLRPDKLTNQSLL